MVELAGSVYNNAGEARDLGSNTVAVFAADLGSGVSADESTSTGSATALTETDSSGNWSFSGLAENRYDVRITDASSIRWLRWSDEISLKAIDIRNDTGATTPAAVFTNLTNSTSNQVASFRGANTTRADGDEIYLSFEMADDGGNLHEFARITADAPDVSNGSEDGQLRFGVSVAGTITDMFTINSSTGGASSISYEVDSFTIKGEEGGPAILYLMADQGDDAGDEWKVNVADAGVLTLGNDIASAGTYVTHMTLTPNSTITSSSVTFPGILDVNGSVDWDVTDVQVDSSGDIDLVSTNDAAAAIYLRENAGTSGTIKIHADQGTSVTEGAESINILSDAGGVGIRSTANLAKAVNITSDGGTTGSIAIFNDQGTSVTEGAESISLLSDAGGVGIRSTANLANAVNITVDGGTTSTMTLFNDQGTSVTEGAESIALLSDAGGVGIRSTANLANAVNLTVDGGTSSTMTLFNDQGTAATEGAASIQLLSDVGGINVKSGLDGANAILLTADGGTSETIVIHADQGTGADSIKLLSDAGGITATAGGAIDVNATGAITVDSAGISIDSSSASNLTTSSGALTITSAAAATWSTAAGVLTIDGDDGIVLNTGGSGNVQVNESLVVGVDDTGYDVKFFGATAGAYMLWDESADALHLNQGTTDSVLFSVSSSDVTHGMTAQAPATTFGLIRQANPDEGGLRLDGFTSGKYGIRMRGFYHTDDTAKSTSAIGGINLESYKRSGTDAGNPGTNANLVVFYSSGSARFAFDTDGDLHLDAGGGAGSADPTSAHSEGILGYNVYDGEPDWQVARAIHASLVPETGFGREHQALVERFRPVLEKRGIVTYNDDGHHFLATKRLALFQLDGLYQIGEAVVAMAKTLRDAGMSLPENVSKLLELEGAK